MSSTLGGTRASVLAAFAEQREQGLPLVGAGVGTALTAHAAIAGGADFVVAYHSATLRFAGLPSVSGLLPLANANELVLEMAAPIINCAAGTPVLATVFAADQLRSLPSHLETLADLGFVGVLNAPTVGMLDGQLRADLEEAGLGFAREVELIRLGRAMEMLTCAYVFDTEQVRAMVGTGADILVVHLGVTRSGEAPTTATVSLLREIARAACDESADAVVLCHGGPLVTPDDVAFVRAAVPALSGVFAASSIERLPVVGSVIEATAAFKRLGVVARS